MSDFENVLDNIVEEDLKDNPKPITQSSNSNKKFDIFEDTVEPLEVNTDTLKKFSRMYAGSSPVKIPNERLEILDRIIEKASTSGFTYRSTADERSKLDIEITERVQRKEYYLPWKTFGGGVENATLNKPTEKAHKISCWFDVNKRESINNAKGKNIAREDIISDYNSLSPAIKGFSARNIHVVLGEDCETALNFMLVYTEDGAEQPMDIKWDKSQKTGYFIEVCYKLNIPVFNLFKDDCETRLIEYIETFK